MKKESSGYAIMTNRSFPSVKGKVKRGGMITQEMRDRIKFMQTHEIIVSRDSTTNEPITIIKERHE